MSDYQERRREEIRREEAEKAKLAASHADYERRQQQKRERDTAWRKDGSTCFASGTEVLTPDGVRRIEDVAAGDDVVAFDTARGFVVAKVASARSHRPTDIWEIVVEGHMPVRTTRNHYFLTKRGWKRAKAVDRSDYLRSSDGWRRVERSVATESKEVVYNLVVACELTFVAGGLVAHSYSFCRALRSMLHRVSPTALAGRPSPRAEEAASPQRA